MSDKNVVYEGFFSWLKGYNKSTAKLTNKEKKFMKMSPKFKKIYNDMDKDIEELEKILKQLED